MPANPKYLTQSPWQRFAKITAAILGGYMVSSLFHLALASWLPHVPVLITSTYTIFLVWVALMVVAFLAKSGYKIWLYYLLVSAILGLLVYIGVTINPITV